MLTLAQVRELNTLIGRAAARRRHQGDPRHPNDIADAMLTELGAPDLEPILVVLRTATRRRLGSAPGKRLTVT